jgi:hypothetical protein
MYNSGFQTLFFTVQLFQTLFLLYHLFKLLFLLYNQVKKLYAGTPPGGKVSPKTIDEGDYYREDHKFPWGQVGAGVRVIGRKI